MAQDVKTTWLVADVNDVMTLGFDYLMVYGCATIDGTYVEITGVGTRPALVANTTTYTYTALNTSYLYFKAKYYASGTGEESDLSVAVGITDTADVAISSLQIQASYMHPEGKQGAWQAFPPSSVLLTKEGLRGDGNRPYIREQDYTLRLAFLYTINSTGVQEGFNLTGTTITFTVYDNTGTAIFTKTTGAEITILSQGVAWSAGGTQGVCEITWADDETGVADYELGTHDFDCVVLWSDDDTSMECSGKFSITKRG